MSDRKKREIRDALRKEDRAGLYAAAGRLRASTEDRVGLRVPVPIYAQDPLVAAEDSGPAVRTESVGWEPGLGDGPTSANLAVVDFDTDTGKRCAPISWNQEEFRFDRPDGAPAEVDDAPDNPWGRQLNAWTTVQGVVEYFADPRVLGRPLGWGFGGHRLTILPHAGRRQNAYYDRRTRSLRLYYFGDGDRPSYTSLSHDILAHEAGHAVLDGIRPFYLEHSSRETAAFHEAFGDLTAILTAFRHGRHDAVASDATTLGPDDFAPWVGGVAEEFGRKNQDRPFLRNAAERLRMDELSPTDGHHRVSTVLTGTVFDLLTRLAAQYLTAERQAERRRPATVRNALWWAADRIGRMAFQPVDLLPPADVRFVDYARALLANLALTDPGDPRGYGELVRAVCHERGLCDRPFESCDPRTCGLAPPSPPRPTHYHGIDRIVRSPAAAYRFLHDNRDDFEIPGDRDFEIVGLYRADKYGAGARRLPGQVVLQYLWRERVKLEGSRFGELAGRRTDLLCGGTVVFDELGNLVSWLHKPGNGTAAGEERRRELLDYLAHLVETGALGGEPRLLDGEEGPTARTSGDAPAVAAAAGPGGAVRLETGFHLCGCGG